MGNAWLAGKPTLADEVMWIFTFGCGVIHHKDSPEKQLAAASAAIAVSA